MKRLTIILAVVMSACTLPVKSAHIRDLPQVIFKFSPQHLIRGGLWMTGEIFNEQRKMSSNISLEALYSRPNPGNRSSGIYNSNGFTLEYMFRYYPSRLHVEKGISTDRISGFYTGFFAQAGNYIQDVRYYNYFSSSSTNNLKTNQIKTTSFYPGFIFGKQFSLGENIFMDLYVGAGMRIANTSLKTDDPDYYYDDSPGPYFIYHNGVLPKAGLSIGMGF
jgi:hypothetical protein